MRENKFKAELIKVLTPQFRVYRIENKLESGMADLLVSRSSYDKPHIWIETKTDKDWLSKNQLQWINRLEDEIMLVAQLINDRVFFYRRNLDRRPWTESSDWIIIYEDTWPDCDQRNVRELILNQY